VNDDYFDPNSKFKTDLGVAQQIAEQLLGAINRLEDLVGEKPFLATNQEASCTAPLKLDHKIGFLKA
jgi:hypothetical protein